MSDLILEARDVAKTFGEGETRVRALRDVDLEVRSGEFLALVGPSGSGKTTFLNLAGALDLPTSGHLRVLGQDLGKLWRRERATVHQRRVRHVLRRDERNSQDPNPKSQNPTQPAHPAAPSRAPHSLQNRASGSFVVLHAVQV